MMSSIKVTKVGGGFVVSDDGTWVPGVFDCPETAREAVSLSPGDIQRLSDRICRFDGEDRAITKDDLTQGEK